MITLMVKTTHYVCVLELRSLERGSVVLAYFERVFLYLDYGEQILILHQRVNLPFPFSVFSENHVVGQITTSFMLIAFPIPGLRR